MKKSAAPGIDTIGGATAIPPQTFAPAPRRATVWNIVRAQGGIESRLMLRHGEQILLSLVIPVVMLVAGSHISLSDQVRGLNQLFPMVLAVAVTSAGFTGQAIALAFDRRYGALKRTGASGVPAWAIIVGKVIAVLSMICVQILVLGLTACVVGFRTSAVGIAMAGLTLIFGVAACTALGLVLGGTQSSEVVLALANLIWFLLLGIVGWVLYSQGLGHNGLLNLVPTVALAGGLTESFAGHFPLIPLLSLLGWATGAASIAAKWFRFDG